MLYWGASTRPMSARNTCNRRTKRSIEVRHEVDRNGELVGADSMNATVRRPNNAAIDARENSVRKQTDVGRQGNLQREQLALR
jgi:hypothetical protein